MKNIILTFLVILSAKIYATTSPLPPVSRIGQGWIKLTCHGVTTPRYADPTTERPIMIGHIKINPSAPYPNFEDLRDQNSNFFKDMTDQCTLRRRAKVEFGSFTGTWLDWGTDWAYTRLELSEEFIPNESINICRQVGHPCESNTQCCGSNRRLTSCNIKMKTCESIIIKTDSTQTYNQN